MLDSTTKRCTKCGEEKPANLEYFYKMRKGLTARCKPCINSDNAKWAENNPEKIKAIKDSWVDRNREKQYASNSKWFDDHPGYQSANKRKHYRLNPIKHLTRSRNWKSANPEKMKLINRRGKHNYRARLLSAEGKFSKCDIEVLIKSQRGMCWWCDKPFGDTYHVDHRIALARGGTNWPNNLCISCAKCNQSKGAKLPHEWSGRLL